jgi:hypothetical protein
VNDYIVRPHPQPNKEDDWVVLITSGDYKHVVFNAHRIEILEEGTRIDIEYNILHGVDRVDDAFDEVVQNIVREVVEDHHNRKTTIYISKKTGEQIEY